MTVETPIPDTAEAATEAMRAALARHCAALADRVADPSAPPGALPRDTAKGSALEAAAGLFRLTPVERDLLCLAAGPDLHAGLADAVAKVTGGVRADVSLALALFGAAAWTALCPAAPLRSHRLLTVEGTGPMLRSGLGVDERVLHFLMGLTYLDSRLEGLVHPVPHDVVAAVERAEKRYFESADVGSVDEIGLADGFVPACGLGIVAPVHDRDTAVIAQAIGRGDVAQATFEGVVEARYLIPGAEIRLELEVIHRLDAFGNAGTAR